MISKVLITGSSGFIGANAVKYFKQIGWEVDGADISEGPMDELLGKKFLLTDYDHDAYFDIVKNQYTYIINSAGSASVPFSFQNPYRDYELNTRIVFSILTALNDHSKHTKFLNLSSAAIYGNPKRMPIQEDDADHSEAISPYGNHKWMSEMICRQYHEMFGIKSACIRIFSAYGPLLKKQLLWDLHMKADHNDVVELWGTGKETRDFIFINDLLKSIELILTTDDENFEVYNVANGVEVSIEDIVSCFMKHYCPNKSYRFNGQVKLGDPIHWCADVTKIKKIGYRRQVDLEAGVVAYVSWLKSLNE